MTKSTVSSFVNENKPSTKSGRIAWYWFPTCILFPKNLKYSLSFISLKKANILKK